MEVDAASRYRSRILREMNANRENPFNSPPSSTGSHGTVSPTMSSVFSDPEGESTRRLNEDIARITAPGKLPVNWDAAHRKWPEFFGKPQSRDVFADDDDDTNTRPLSAESKENKPPAIAVRFMDDSTQDAWLGSKRTRAEMQPRVDNESDLSLAGKPPARSFSYKSARHPSPLSKVQTQTSSRVSSDQHRRHVSISEALDRLRQEARSPKTRDQDRPAADSSPHQLSSAKSSLTAVPPSPAASMVSPNHSDSNARSFFMPDISHLGDFVTGTLRFSGAMKNGVPVFVKNGKVHDQQASRLNHAEVDGLEVPEDEEKIFVSMDMIRDEIISLQEHYDKVQEYASNLQLQVERLEAQLKSRKHVNDDFSSHQANERLMNEKTMLEMEVTSLKTRLEEVTRKTSLNEIENDALRQEKDRALRKLQEACEDINKLTRKLSTKEKELETSHKRLEFTEQTQQDNDTLRRDLAALKHGREAVELENKSLSAENETLRRAYENMKQEVESLRGDNNTTRREHQSLFTENRSLRSSNQTLISENEHLRENLDGAQHELDAAREEVETLQQDLQTVNQEKTTLREDNDSLVRHNEKYFSENKVLRRENSGFERSIHDLHDDNQKLKDEVEFLKQQLDHCRPAPKDDLTIDEEDEEEEEEDDEMDENMTSAFFIPDITMNTNEREELEAMETKDLPELTSQSAKLPTLPDLTEQETRNTTKHEGTTHGMQQRARSESKNRSKNKSKASSTKTATQSAKVAFSMPDRSQQSTTNLANQGSKRRVASKSSERSSHKALSTYELDQLEDETTGMQSMDNTTQDQSIQLEVAPKATRESKAKDAKRYSTTHESTSHSHRSQQHTRSHSRTSQRHTTEFTVDTVQTVDKDGCPALSSDARRVLDGLCAHNCRNCTVCSRITSHRGVLTSADIAAGKKRVSVARPVPVTDRDLTTDNMTMRPAQSPGHALALVIKGLEDEAHHLQLELTRLQAKYNAKDKALGRRERLDLAETIRTLFKRLEAKDDQIYSLYDVLEGQKAAGQAMTEEEVEMTVLNITGMTVRDVTGVSDQLTWQGIEE